MATTTSAPALDLTSEHDRPIVRIDRQPYEVRVLEDLSMVDIHRMDKLRPRIEELAKKLERQESTEEECAELEGALDTACALALDAPTDALAKLSPMQELMVFRVFQERLQLDFQLASAKVQAIFQTGTSSSPASPASTVPAPGRRPSRSGKSARA